MENRWRIYFIQVPKWQHLTAKNAYPFILDAIKNMRMDGKVHITMQTLH
jgi:hypothetical protein